MWRRIALSPIDKRQIGLCQRIEVFLRRSLRSVTRIGVQTSSRRWPTSTSHDCNGVECVFVLSTKSRNTARSHQLAGSCPFARRLHGRPSTNGRCRGRSFARRRSAVAAHRWAGIPVPTIPFDHALETTSPRDRFVFPASELACRAVRSEQCNAHSLDAAPIHCALSEVERSNQPRLRMSNAYPPNHRGTLGGRSLDPLVSSEREAQR
jgi:hypothetical protein